MIKRVGDDCAVNQDCSSWTFAGIMIVNVVLFKTSLLAIFGIQKQNNQFMRIANVLFILFGFLLLLMAIVLSMASGVISDINSYYDDNWPEIRAELNADDYCDDVGPKVSHGLQLQSLWRIPTAAVS